MHMHARPEYHLPQAPVKLKPCTNTSSGRTNCWHASPTSWCDFDLAHDEARLEEVERQSADPAFWNDADAARTVMQELATLRARVETWRGLERRVRDVVELLELASEEEDDSVVASAVEEMNAVEKQLEKLEFELQLSGEYDARNAILAVHAGAGGTESQDWAEMLLRMYLRWGERHGFQVELLDTTEGEEAGIKSATMEITGPTPTGTSRASAASTGSYGSRRSTRRTRATRASRRSK